MMKQGVSRVGIAAMTPAVVMLGLGAVAALGVGAQLGAWRNPEFVALGAFVVAAAFAAARYPLLGFIGVVIVTVGNLADVLIRFWGAPSITVFLVPGLTIILLCRLIVWGERPFLHGGALAATIVFVIITFLSSIYAHDFFATIHELDIISRNMVIVILTLCFLAYQKSFRYLGNCIIFVGVFCAFIAAYKYGIAGDIDNQYMGFARTAHGGPRLAGTSADPNNYGALLVLILPFVIDRTLWSGGGWRRLLWLVAVAAVLASIMLTRSRGALIATGFGGLLFALTLERKLAIRFIGVGVVAAIATLGLLSEDLLARFTTIVDVAATGEAPDLSVSGRLAAWAVAIQLFHDHPLLGVGAGNFNTLFQTTANDLGLIFVGSDLSPHGLFLEVLAEYGTVGLAVYLAILAFAARGILLAMALLRAQGDLRAHAMVAAFGVGLASHLAAKFFLHSPGERLLWIFITVAIALPAIVRHRLSGRSYGADPIAGQSVRL